MDGEKPLERERRIQDAAFTWAPMSDFLRVVLLGLGNWSLTQATAAYIYPQYIYLFSFSLDMSPRVPILGILVPTSKVDPVDAAMLHYEARGDPCIRRGGRVVELCSGGGARAWAGARGEVGLGDLGLGQGLGLYSFLGALKDPTKVPSREKPDMDFFMPGLEAMSDHIDRENASRRKTLQG